MARQLDGKVVVITGASSGIGRATAHRYAQAGAAVVLAARREPLLREAAEEAIEAGGRAMSVPTDVRDRDQVERLARRAIDGFGGIDIWINNAGIGSFGKFEDTPPDAFAAVVDTTFHGTVNGFRAVLPHFRQRRQGTVITTASVAGRIPTPYQSPYVAAKHAVLGFVETVRQELEQDGLHDIHVCSVLPGPIDTPFWQHSANYSGRQVKGLSPMHPPEDVAEVLFNLALKPRREAGVGAPPWLLELGMALAQGPTERLLARQTAASLFGDRRQPPDSGALMRPSPDRYGTTGGWREREDAGSNGAGTGIALAGVLAVAVPLGLAAFLRYQRAGQQRAGQQRDDHPGTVRPGARRPVPASESQWNGA